MTQRGAIGAREMNQWVKYFWWAEFNPQNPHKSQVWCPLPVIQMLGVGAKPNQGWGCSSVVYLPSKHKTLGLNFSPTKVSYLLLKGKGVTRVSSGTEVFAEALLQITKERKHHKRWPSGLNRRHPYDKLLAATKQQSGLNEITTWADFQNTLLRERKTRMHT